LARSRSARKKYTACELPKNSIPLRYPASISEGRIADVTTREAGMRWTRQCRSTSGRWRVRRNRVVLAPQVLGAKSAAMLAHHADDGGKRDGSPRRARISRKTTAQGRPVVTACTCGFRARAILLLRGSPGCSGHPAFPAPSDFREGDDDAKLGRIPPRGCGHMSFCCHCEEQRDEAIQSRVRGSGLLRSARNDGVRSLKIESKGSPRVRSPRPACGERPTRGTRGG
jgi:hypothetical protein